MRKIVSIAFAFIFSLSLCSVVSAADVESCGSGSKNIMTQSIRGDELISPYNVTGEALVQLIRKMGSFPDVPGSKIVFNRRTAQLFVKHTPSGHNEIEDILNSLREVYYRQIEIEARILKITSTDVNDIGLDFLGIDAKGANGTTVLGTDSAFDGAYTTNIDFPSTTGSSANDTGGQLGFAVLDSDLDLKAYLQALKTKAVINTLSAPKLVVANNQRANIKIEKAKYYVDSISADSSGSAVALDPEIAIAQSGTILDVTPTINANNTISLELHPVFASVDTSNVQKIDLGNRIADSLQPEVTLPVYSIHNADTTLTVMNGGVAVIGGLIEEKETSKEYKIPLLGDIPIIGKMAFSNSQKRSEKSFILIFVKAKVIDNRKSHLRGIN